MQARGVRPTAAAADQAQPMDIATPPAADAVPAIAASAAVPSTVPAEAPQPPEPGSPTRIVSDQVYLLQLFVGRHSPLIDPSDLFFEVV